MEAVTDHDGFRLLPCPPLGPRSWHDRSATIERTRSRHQNRIRPRWHFRFTVRYERGKTVYWTSYNRLTSSVVLVQTGIQIYECVEHNGDAINFTYGPDRQRIKEEHYSGGTLQTRTTVVGPHFEKVEEAGLTVYKHYIRAGSRVVAVHDRKSDGQHATHYLHRDHLGSVDAISDKDGNVVARMSFDAFGQRRSSLDWNIGFPPGTELDPIRDVTTRGYTGHHMVDAVKLIHMGGRVYDPELGRFLSPDPNIPDPHLTQGYNRYSYVYNNPLSNTDPSGFVTVRQEMTQEEWDEYFESLTAKEKKEAQEKRRNGEAQLTVDVGPTSDVTVAIKEAQSTLRRVILNNNGVSSNQLTRARLILSKPTDEENEELAKIFPEEKNDVVRQFKAKSNLDPLMEHDQRHILNGEVGEVLVDQAIDLMVDMAPLAGQAKGVAEVLDTLNKELFKEIRPRLSDPEEERLNDMQVIELYKGWYDDGHR